MEEEMKEMKIELKEIDNAFKKKFGLYLTFQDIAKVAEHYENNLQFL
jgi:hypothetical protein